MDASFFLVASIWAALVASVHSAVHLDEIHSITYHVDILNKPVMSSEASPSGSVMRLSSKYGQAYQCHLPEIPGKRDDVKSNDDPSSPTHVLSDIAVLLKPLETGPCLVKTKDWWTYEFCYGKHIKQYHLEDNKIVSPVIVLGLYESEYDWKNTSNKDGETSRNRLQRYHSQYYVNGTKCEVTGTPRRSEVRFLCEEGAGDYVSHVNEPESCRYVITVHTTRVCHHPYLRPPPTHKPHPIVCRPVLTATQYAVHQKREEEDKKLVEEKRKAWLAKQEERLVALKRAGRDEPTSKKASARTEDEPVVPDPVAESPEGPFDPLLRSDDAKPEPPERPDASEEKGRRRTELDVVDDAETLFGEIRDLSERLQLVGKELESSDEERAEGREDRDPREAIHREVERVKKLSYTLGQLLRRYDEAERELNRIDEMLRRLEREERHEDGDTETRTDKSEEVVTQKTGLRMESATEDKDESTSGGKSGPLRLKVRKITPELLNLLKRKHRQRRESQTKDGEETDRDGTDVIERAVVDHLKQSGLDTLGTKVEVKIIPAGYFNDENDSFQRTNEEESDQLQAILIKLLASNDEVTEQLQRQNDLEKNYGFVWDGKKTTTDYDAPEEE